MKKIFVISASAILLAVGCQKTEIINPAGGDTITFSASLNKITKAANDSGADNLKAQDFHIWAYTAEDNPNTMEKKEANAEYDGMVGLKFEYKEGKWVPETKKDYYWPGEGKHLKFFAISGHTGEGVTTVVKPTIDETKETDDGLEKASIEITDFAITDQNYNTDLLVADFIKQHQKQNGRVVKPQFHHALSKVQFCFKTIAEPEANIFVESLYVKELEAQGNLKVTYAGKVASTENTPEVANVKFEWNTAAAAVAPNQTFTDDYKTEYEGTDFPANIEVESTQNHNKEVMPLTTTAEPFTTWLMLPQTVVDKKVVITYLVNERRFTATLALDKDPNVQKWVENQFVRYTVTLAPTKVLFDASTMPWTQYDANSSNTDNDDIEMVN